MPSGETPGAGQEEPAAEATVLRMLLGAQLRRLREAAGISAEKAGYEIRASRSKISRMETGRVGFKLRDIEDLLTLYGMPGGRERAKVIALASRSREPEWWAQYTDILPDWFETYLGLELAAAAIRSFEAQFVPGLFQTEDYARAVTRLGHQTAPESEVERRVGLRLGRQGLLARPQPPRIWAVMDEAVLRRPIGGTAVMRAQLFHLAEAARLPGVRLQVVEFAGAVTPPRAGRSRSCASRSGTCQTWSTWSSSPAPSTWTSARTSSTTSRSPISSAARH